MSETGSLVTASSSSESCANLTWGEGAVWHSRVINRMRVEDDLERLQRERATVNPL
jgi:hypothetical protein